MKGSSVLSTDGKISFDYVSDFNNVPMKADDIGFCTDSSWLDQRPIHGKHLRMIRTLLFEVAMCRRIGAFIRTDVAFFPAWRTCGTCSLNTD